MTTNTCAVAIAMSDRQRAQKILMVLRQATKDMTRPMVALIKELFGQDPFLILVSCLLSLRAKDANTFVVCKQLFARARTPAQLLTIPIPELEKIIFSTGFYRKKARLLHAVSSDLIKRFDNKVPASLPALLSIKGIGRKTANLVLGEGFGIPAICVDTHVHKVANRLAIVKTKTPEQTEEALAKLIPQDQWIELNQLFVMWGQNICVPISPFCSRCPLYSLCCRSGVTHRR